VSVTGLQGRGNGCTGKSDSNLPQMTEIWKPEAHGNVKCFAVGGTV
jgi:hypothetical protein